MDILVCAMPGGKYDGTVGSCHGVAFVGRVSPEQGPQIAATGGLKLSIA